MVSSAVQSPGTLQASLVEPLLDDMSPQEEEAKEHELIIESKQRALDELITKVAE
jgi:hypothetical protein